MFKATVTTDIFSLPYTGERERPGYCGMLKRKARKGKVSTKWGPLSAPKGARDWHSKLRVNISQESNSCKEQHLLLKMGTHGEQQVAAHVFRIFSTLICFTQKQHSCSPAELPAVTRIDTPHLEDEKRHGPTNKGIEGLKVRGVEIFRGPLEVYSDGHNNFILEPRSLEIVSTI